MDRIEISLHEKHPKFTTAPTALIKKMQNSGTSAIILCVLNKLKAAAPSADPCSSRNIWEIFKNIGEHS